jgi:hypothetical protein
MLTCGDGGVPLTATPTFTSDTVGPAHGTTFSADEPIGSFGTGLQVHRNLVAAKPHWDIRA